MLPGPDGTVKVSAVEAGGLVTVTVTDDGPGMDEEVRTRVFEAFFTTKPEGTGLGLPLARQVLRAHGADLDLASPAEGGTSAYFRLRIADSA